MKRLSVALFLVAVSAIVFAGDYITNGSQYDPNSINNPYGKYGSPYSPTSPNNPYIKYEPKLYDESGNYSGTLSNDPYKPDSTSNPYGIYGSEHSPRSINNQVNRSKKYYIDD